MMVILQFIPLTRVVDTSIDDTIDIITTTRLRDLR